MTKRKEPDLSDRQIEELLPFYVNETLSNHEFNLVKNRIEQSPDLQAEVHYLKKLRKSIQSKVIVNSPGEFGLNRLKKEIAKQSTNDNRRYLWWKPVAICASIALAALVSLNTITYFSSDQGFIVAGSESDIDTPVLQVIFRAEATEGEIRRTLREFNLSIVDGPSALGLYRIRLIKDVTDQQLVDILATLKSRNFIEDVREE